MTIVSPMGRLFKQMLPIRTTDKMFKLIKRVINRVSNILNNKNKGVFNNDVKTFSSISQAKKGAPFDRESSMPKISQKASTVRIDTFDIKNVFNKMPIIQK